MNMWWEKAACQGEDPDLFFPEYSIEVPMPLRMSKTEIQIQEQIALGVCRECPVQHDCLQDGLLDEYGIRGGMTAAQRGVIRRQMRKVAA